MIAGELMDNFISELENFMLDYRPKNGSDKYSEMLQWKEKFIPKKLYRHRPVNEYSLKNLRENTAWLSSPDEFNDPFDSILSCESQEKHLIDIAKKSFETTGISFDSLDVIIGAIKDEMTRCNIDFYDSMRKNMGVICFSEVKDSILMWSRYADFHKGFSVGYDVATFTDKSHTNCLYPVIYNDTMFDYWRHIGDVLNDNINHCAIKLMAMYKSTTWKYENEWRLIWSGLGGLGIINNAISFPQPAELYLGAKISYEDTKRVLSCIEGKAIKVYQMQLASNSFQLVAKEFTDIDKKMLDFRPSLDRLKRLYATRDSMTQEERNIFDSGIEELKQELEEMRK